ncbi:MAG: hypothetical protein SPI77_09265 [Corynebacterium sp.]|nr:hypothetical protein [Corynebacterium sp.]
MSEYLPIISFVPIEQLVSIVTTELSVKLAEDHATRDEYYFDSENGSPVIVKTSRYRDDSIAEALIMVDTDFAELQDEIWNKLITLPYRSTRFDVDDEITAEHDLDSALSSAG